MLYLGVMALSPDDSRRASASKWLTTRRVWMAVTVAVLASVGVILWSVVEGASWRALTSVSCLLYTSDAADE